MGGADGRWHGFGRGGADADAPACNDSFERCR
nr:MAG TPA: hypothetical protein [Caudoviricetes sp.]